MNGFVPRPRPGQGSAVPLTLLVVVLVYALMGRFTLDRLGFTEFGEVDLRLVAGPVLLVAVLLWRFRPDAPYRYPAWPPIALWALALFGSLALSAFWAPLGARVGDRLLDLLVLALLVVLVVVLARADPARARRVVLLTLLVAGVVYAGLGLFAGETNVQGRTVALGGGPNVFIRVVGLGIIAAVALAVLHRRRLFLVPIPLMVVAALFSGSRGGLLSLGVTALVFVMLCGRRITGRAVAAVVVVAAAALVALVTLIDGATLQLLQERLVTDLFVQDQFSGRPQLFAQTLELFLAHPWSGGGLDAFYVAFGRSEDLGYPHNLVLEVAATAGLPALALLAAAAVSMTGVLRGPGRPDGDRIALLLCAVLIAVASMTSGDLYDSRFLWILAVLAMLPAHPARYAGKNEPAARPAASRA